MAGLSLIGIEKRFGAAPILQGVTVEAEPGEFIALVGPSGCGKTTLLRIAAGLEAPDSGRVLLGGRDVTALRPADRDVAMVFQSYALYPHLTAFQNMAVPLAMRRLSGLQRLPFVGGFMPGSRAIRAGIADTIGQAARTLKIEALLDRKPAKMSGGQRQRVALGRALVRQPRAFLMDEPLSNLDAGLRVHTRGEIVELHRQAGVTTLYVTHDQSEALGMADRVAVMIGGRLLQLAPPDAIYRDPDHVEVAAFLGSPRINLLDGMVDGAGRVQVAGVALATGHEPATAVTVGIRPEHLRVLAPGQTGLPARVARVEFQGAERIAHLALLPGGPTMMAKLAPDGPPPAERVAVGAAPEAVLVFDADGRRRRGAPVEPVRVSSLG